MSQLHPGQSALVDLLGEVSEFYRRQSAAAGPASAYLQRAAELLRCPPPASQAQHRSMVPVAARLPQLSRSSSSSNVPAAAVLRRLLDLEPHAGWRQNAAYTADALGAAFVDNYGYFLIVGPGGFCEIPELLLGALLLGPDVYYPPHLHPAVEIYHPLSGHANWTRSGESRIEEPGALVFHQSNEVHSMCTTAEPLLALFCWLDHIDVPARLKAPL